MFLLIPAWSSFIIQKYLYGQKETAVKETKITKLLSGNWFIINNQTNLNILVICTRPFRHCKWTIYLLKRDIDDRFQEMWYLYLIIIHSDVLSSCHLSIPRMSGCLYSRILWQPRNLCNVFGSSHFRWGLTRAPRRSLIACQSKCCDQFIFLIVWLCTSNWQQWLHQNCGKKSVSFTLRFHSRLKLLLGKFCATFGKKWLVGLDRSLSYLLLPPIRVTSQFWLCGLF